MRKKTLLYFYVGKSTFTDKDFLIFSEHYKVYEFNFIANAKWKNILLFCKQFYFLVRHLFSSQLFVSQFSGYHAFLPALFSKVRRTPFLIIAGGTDCHSFPSIGYGNFQKVALGLVTRLSYSMCTHIAPKHISLWECDYTYDSNDFKKQGIHFFMPNLDKPITCIPNGYDASNFQLTGQKKKNSILTIAGNLNYPFQVKLKGIDLFMQVAENFPNCTFTLVGVNDPSIFTKIPGNVICVPSLTHHQLISLYNSHTFYFQLSMAEGFPNTLCEAMLCECVPVGSNVFSIPEIIGDCGFILLKKDIIILSELFKEALESDTKRLGEMGRLRIANNYPLQKRKESLLQLCNSLMISKATSKK